MFIAFLRCGFDFGNGKFMGHFLQHYHLFAKHEIHNIISSLISGQARREPL
jgi:hypothetical protein